MSANMDKSLSSQKSQELYKCPICGGQGTLSKPPWIAGDVSSWTASESSYPCKVCNGSGVILRERERD